MILCCATLKPYKQPKREPSDDIAIVISSLWSAWYLSLILLSFTRKIVTGFPSLVDL